MEIPKNHEFFDIQPEPISRRVPINPGSFTGNLHDFDLANRELLICPERPLFTSESVSEGHPDKMADQISDGILDALLAQDANARVACETLVKTGMVVLAGEITTDAWVDVEEICREVILNIGYNQLSRGFRWRQLRRAERHR